MKSPEGHWDELAVHHFGFSIDGGAGVAMSRIHDGLKVAGIRSKVWCGLDPYRPLPEDVHLYPPRKRRIGPSEQRWWNRVHRVGPKLMAKEALYEFNVPFFPPFLGTPRIVGPGEVAHLH